jgi:N-acetylmuramoyl-L-alanine amidase
VFNFHLRPSRSFLALTILLLLAAGLAQGPQAYTVIAADGRRTLPFRSIGATDLVPIDQVASQFNVTTQEDAPTAGLIVTARNQRVVLTAGQSLASISGRIVSLSGPVVREGSSWLVPVDFLSRAPGPALGMRIEVRRPSHLILVGDVRVPTVTARFERLGATGRLTVEAQPAVVRRVNREGSRLVIRFEADGLDASGIAGGQPEFVGPSRVEGSALAIDLGPAAATFRVDDADPARLTIDLIPSGAAAPGPSAPAPPPNPPVVDLTPAGTIRTVAIDAGHGGDDAGSRGAGGAHEKGITLQLARRLKGAIESRLGLRVVLTRDSDETVAVDRRTAFANNNKADVLLSLHANASLRPSVRGAQILSLSLDDYKARARGLAPGAVVPLAGGGTRFVEAVPWDLAQLPYAAKSAALAAIAARHLGEQHVAMYSRGIDQAPLRVLVGANMPAILIEIGFLTNADDEKAIAAGELPNAVVEALVATLTEIRGGIPTPTAPR